MLLLSATGTSLTWAEDTTLSPYAATLREYGIEPDAAGLGEYLRQLHPDEQLRRETHRLIKQLGSARFAGRESATRRLMALPISPTEALQIAANGRDPEVRLRAKKILAAGTPQRLVLMHAVFKTIEREKVPGLTAELLRAAALCDQRHLRLAVRATVRPDDASLLRKATNDDDKEVAAAAIGGLGAALGKSARDDLRRLMEHKTEAISLAAARALANQGDRTSLGRLVRLLDAASLGVRVGAVKTLRQVSHTRHNYLAYEDVPARKEAMGRWAAWADGEGRTAKLHFPLMYVELGRTLITLYEQNKVIELDASGKQVWEKTGLNRPWASRGLTNGHRLISSEGGCIEYDASGKEVWRKDGLPQNPHDSRRLENGNTLIACSLGKKVLEIRPDGSIAWEITFNERPMDVRRLDSGRTLVTLQDGGGVVEVDRVGKVHWEIKGLSGPMTSQRLENGNTLVAERSRGRVAEWDRGGKIVWQQSGLQKPRSAQRLSNGNTLIVLQDLSVQEVDRHGEVIWQKQMTGVKHATRY